MQMDFTLPYTLFNERFQDLIEAISEKFQVDPFRVTHVMYAHCGALHVVVNERFVRELPEGQNVVVDFALIQSDQASTSAFANVPRAEGLMDDIVGIRQPAEHPLEVTLMCC